MKIQTKRYFASFVLTAYLITLIAASFHFHELNINKNKLHFFDKAYNNHKLHFISQDLCTLQIFLSNDFNLTSNKPSFENRFYFEIKFISNYNLHLYKALLLNKSLRAPPIS